MNSNFLPNPFLLLSLSLLFCFVHVFRLNPFSTTALWKNYVSSSLCDRSALLTEEISFLRWVKRFLLQLDWVTHVDGRDQFAKAGYAISVAARLSDTRLKHQSLEKHVHWVWVWVLVRCKVLLTKWRCQIWSYWQGEDVKFDELLTRWRCQIWLVTDKVKVSNLIELLTRWRCQIWWIGVTDKVKMSNLISYWQGEDVKFDRVTDKVKMSNLIELLTRWRCQIW